MSLIWLLLLWWTERKKINKNTKIARVSRLEIDLMNFSTPTLAGLNARCVYGTTCMDRVNFCVTGSSSGVSEDKQDPLFRSSVLVWLGDTGAETAEERDRRQRIRLRGGGLEHEFAEFAARTGTQLS